MTNGLTTFCAALAALIGALLLVRLGGQFVAGHTIRFVERYRNRRKGK